MIKQIFTSTRNIASALLIFALMIFFISIAPASFSAGYLAGIAGAQSGRAPAVAEYGNIAQIGLITSVFSAIVAAVTGIATMILKMREEKRLQVQFEFERQKGLIELEKLKLEVQKQVLELERYKKQEKAKR